MLARRSGETAWTLLIVEREGSAPGNERSILKWHEALRREASVELRYRSQMRHAVEVGAQQAMLLLAFGQSTSWSGTSYVDTVAFCEVLADMVNMAPQLSGIALRVHVADFGAAVTDWQLCGKHFGRDILGLLESL